MIKHFLAHIEDRSAFGYGFLRHPLGQAVIFLCKSSPAVEFALQVSLPNACKTTS
jgi:hypothetical protein